MALVEVGGGREGRLIGSAQTCRRGGNPGLCSSGKASNDAAFSDWQLEQSHMSEFCRVQAKGSDAVLGGGQVAALERLEDGEAAMGAELELAELERVTEAVGVVAAE